MNLIIRYIPTFHRRQERTTPTEPATLERRRTIRKVDPDAELPPLRRHAFRPLQDMGFTSREDLAYKVTPATPIEGPGLVQYYAAPSNRPVEKEEEEETMASKEGSLMWPSQEARPTLSVQTSGLPVLYTGDLEG